MIRKLANKVKTANTTLPENSLIYLLASTIAIFFLIAVVLNVKKDTKLKASNAAASSFIFTAAGDYGQNSRSQSVFQGIANSSAAFHLVLGDFSYSGAGSEQPWCDFVKANVGSVPIQLQSGNHEDDGPDGIIDNYTACLPNNMPNLVGTYAKESYFDYQGLARFIQISPNLSLNGEVYQYQVGTPHYDWLASAIDQARANGIKWIVVSMHEDCLSMGVKSCEIGPDLMNLLISKNVDVVLQGHDHEYQRSKQLSLNSSCTSLVPNTFNPSCVADDGSDGSYTEGNGTVFVIAGMGGIGWSDINTSDPEAPYFAKWDGGSNMRTGFMKFTVSDTGLTGDYVGTTTNSTFSDSFSILPSGLSPTPTSTPTPSPIPSQNLLQNGSFDVSGSNWMSPWRQNLKSPAQATITQDTLDKQDGIASAKVNITTAATDWYEQLLQGNVPLTAGVPHTISFWAKANINRPIRIGVQQNYSPYTTYYQQTINITTAWQKYTINFTPSVNDSNTLFVFNLAQTAGQVWIDNASITKPQSGTPTPTPTATLTPTPIPSPTPTPTPLPTQNKILNSSFENTGTPWISPWLINIKAPAQATTSQDSTTAEQGIRSAKINITTASTDWYYQLLQKNLSLVTGSTYTLSFWAKANINRPVRIAIQQSASPYAVYKQQTFSITTSWQKYTTTYQSSVNQSDAMLIFNLAQTTGQVWIDDVSFSK